MNSRNLALAAVSLATLGASASPALALDQVVSGTTASNIAISAGTPAAFSTGFSPGNTASSTGGTLTTVSTNPSWTLSVKDGAASGANGRMDAAATGCTGSDSELTNALSVSVLPAVANGSITSTTRSLTSSDQTAASASAVPLASTVFNTNYSQVIPSAQQMLGGCVYSLTSTYTLAAV